MRPRSFLRGAGGRFDTYYDRYFVGFWIETRIVEPPELDRRWFVGGNSYWCCTYVKGTLFLLLLTQFDYYNRILTQPLLCWIVYWALSRHLRVMTIAKILIEGCNSKAVGFKLSTSIWRVCFLSRLTVHTAVLDGGACAFLSKFDCVAPRQRGVD